MISDRKIPDFAVIGAMKAGTTTLYHYLLAHPDVGMSRMKETDYFIESANHSLGRKWYLSQFEPGKKIYGEVSPNYTKHDIFPRVPQNLAASSPDARLIFLARDPVARFASHYVHAWQLGHMDVAPQDILNTKNGQHMLETSRYAAQMDTYLQVFDRAQILMLDFDQLRTEPQAVMDQVCAHIGVDSIPVADIGAQNDAGSIARMPRGVQRLWRSKAGRMLDPLISREMRDFGRRMLARGKARVPPKLNDDILAQAGAALRADADRFREMSGLTFDNWPV